MQSIRVSGLSVRIADVSDVGENPSYRVIIRLHHTNQSQTDVELSVSTANLLSRALRTALDQISLRTNYPVRLTRGHFNACYGVRDDGQSHGQAMNLDGMPDADLEIAREHPALHLDVRAYAAALLVARKERLAGNIDDAMKVERSMERLYNSMPAFLRW